MIILPATSPAEAPSVRIVVAGVPHAQPRPRFVNGVAVSTIGPRIKRWRLMLQAAIQDAAHSIGEAELEVLNRFPLALAMEFRFQVPPKHKAWQGTPHWHKPDCDNLAKPVMDELVKARMIDDDARIARAGVSKLWASPLVGGPGMTLVLVALDGPRAGRPQKEAGAGEAPAWLEEGPFSGVD